MYQRVRDLLIRCYIASYLFTYCCISCMVGWRVRCSFSSGRVHTTLKVFSMTFENLLCAVSRIIYDVYSMSFFQDCLIKWLLNKSDFYIH